MVVFDPATGEVDSLKTSSTPATPGQAIVNALDEGGVDAAELDTFTHGTTVGTNALIERTGCKVAFVTTKGFEDAPFIQRINRKVLYDLRWTKPQPLVASRRLCLGLAERLDSAGGRGEAGRRGGGAASSRARSATSGAEAVALCLLFSYVRTDHEERVKEILAEELPGVPISVSSEVAPIWREYERSSTTIADAYLRPLFGRYVGEPRRRAPQRRHDGRVDDHEVERRRDALRRGGGGADPDRDVGARGRDDRDRAHRARARGDERAHPRHGRDERRRRHPRRRRAAAHDRVRDRVGPPGGGAADRHQVDRRRRRLDRVGGRGRLPPRRPPERRRRSGPDLLRPRRHRGDGHRREPAARPPQSRVLPRRSDAPRPVGGDARRWRRSASRSASPRSSSPRRSSRSRTRTWRARSRWSRSSGATIPAASRSSPSAEPGRCTRRRSPACSAFPKVIVPQHPGVFSALGLLLADIRVDKMWTQAFRSNAVDAPLVNRQFERITERALAELRQEGFAGEPEVQRAINMRYFGQNYEHEVEIETRRVGRGSARAGVPPLRRAPRRALRLRDRRRGDRARQLQGDRDRQAGAARPLARERRDGRSRARSGPSTSAATDSSTRPSRTAPRSSRASRSPGLP